ncbi:MAG: hypothetical protein JJ975_14010, partial [Bacteroidia bacterium]|nr:hypothetical protein [Bacteroidia bacterium]
MKNKVLYMNKIRIYVVLLQIGLLVSGLTAFWIPQGVAFLVLHTPLTSIPGLEDWLLYVLEGVISVDTSYPFIWYGTDWMVFAHILFAILFFGLFQDPVRNRWLVTFGLIACILIFPLALGMGHIRGIPVI